MKKSKSKEFFMNRLSRIVSIMIDLMNHKVVGTNYLANKYEVSTRTIYRDIELLTFSGIPILSERGKSGGFSIIEGFKIDKRILTETEFSIILRGLQTLIHHEDKEAQVVYDKIISIIENTKKEKIIQHSNDVVIDITPFEGQKQISDYYHQIHSAIEKRNLVKITYHSVGKGISTRIIEPLTLIFKEANWYVYAFCQKKQDYRYFKLTRIQGIEVLANHFNEREIPVEEISNSFNDGEKVEIVLQTDKEFSWQIQDNYQVTKVEEKDDFVFVTLTYPLSHWVYAAILSFGDRVVVVSPETIKNNILAKINKMKDLYQK